MTIEQLREKIAYRTNKMNWCISVGRETQAEWNRNQIARLEESIRVMEQDSAIDAAMEAIGQRLIESNINRGRGNDESFNPCVETPRWPTASNRPRPARNRPRPASNTDEDFDYV